MRLEADNETLKPNPDSEDGQNSCVAILLQVGANYFRLLARVLVLLQKMQNRFLIRGGLITTTPSLLKHLYFAMKFTFLTRLHLPDSPAFCHLQLDFRLKTQGCKHARDDVNSTASSTWKLFKRDKRL